MIVQSICSSFKNELALGLHDFTNHTFKIALYTSSASLGETTTVYTTDEEVSGDGYTAGGATLTVNTPVISGSTLIIDFDDVTWSAATITARGALIYNSSSSDAAVMVLNFGTDRSTSGTDYVIRFPEASGHMAILRIR